MKFAYTLRSPSETVYEHIARMLVTVLMGIFMIIAICGNLGFAGSGFLPGHSILNSIFAVVVTVIFLSMFVRFAEKTADAYKSRLMVIFTISFVFRIIMINAWPIEPTSDFKDVYDTALGLSNTYISDLRSYMRTDGSMFYTTWSAHTPFLLMQTAVLKIFGEGTYALQVIFSLFSSLSCVVAAAIAKEMYGRRAGIVAGIVMSVLPVNLMYTPVLTNQHMATFFFLLAIYLIAASPFKWRLANIGLAGISAAISELIRPEMIVFVVAVVCYFFYKYILNITSKRRARRRVNKFMSRSVMFVGAYIVVIFIVNISLMQGGLIRSSIFDTNPKYKIAVGLNSESMGMWNEADYALVDEDEKLDELISERTQNIGGVIGLGAQKIAYQYGNYAYPWSVEGKSESFINSWYGPLTNDVMLVILILCLAGVVLSLIHKSHREMFLMIIMVGYFIAFWVIEVQNRYNYFMIPLFIVMASGSAMYFNSKAKLLWEKVTNKVSDK